MKGTDVRTATMDMAREITAAGEAMERIEDTMAVLDATEDDEEEVDKEVDAVIRSVTGGKFVGVGTVPSHESSATAAAVAAPTPSASSPGAGVSPDAVQALEARFALLSK
jgi:hypothetical protein